MSGMAERKWNVIGTEKGMEMERKLTKGMEMERKGTEMERKWNANGTQTKKNTEFFSL